MRRNNEREKANSQIVAKLSDKAPYPYTSLSLSPYGKIIVIAGKDTVRFVSIKPSGLQEVKSIRIAQYFQATRSIGLDTNHNKNIPNSQQKNNLKDLFAGSPVVQVGAHQNATSSSIAINITDIAWSYQYDDDDDNILRGGKSNDMMESPLSNNSIHGGANETSGVGLGTDNIKKDTLEPNLHHAKARDPFESIISIPGDLKMAGDSLIAAAGSNGVVVIWRACDLIGQGFHNNQHHYNNPNNGAGVGGGLFGGVGSGGGTTSTNRNENPHFMFLQDYMNHQAGDRVNRRTDSAAASAHIGQPEAVLVEHTRAVNRIAWHPRRPGIFLTASQDATVKIFERKEHSSVDLDQHKRHNESSKWTWFSKQDGASTTANNSSSAKSYFWQCAGTFKPNCGPIRDIKWSTSTINDDLFAMVTNNGFLVVHNMRLVSNGRPMIRIAAHAGEATTLDWHPTEPYIVATGGVDRTVKVWDLESELNFHRGDSADNFKSNANSIRSVTSIESSSLVSADTSSPISTSEDQLSNSYHGISSTYNSYNNSGLSLNSHSTGFMVPVSSSGTLLKPTGAYTTSSRTPKNAAFTHLYELSVAAQVEKLRWRPPKRNFTSERERHLSGSNFDPDHHVSMLAVATSPASGTTAGGYGTVSLWSYHRPYMPLSIVEGHKEGAVTDFLWLDTPEIDDQTPGEPILKSLGRSMHSSKIVLKPLKKNSYAENESMDQDQISLSGTWQHVLSIGRDGNCIVQSFARGERPLSNVAPSAFAITNLSPFQRGFGSLQLVSAHQKVPSGENNDYLFCGLRRDEVTAQAPGIFQEIPPISKANINKFAWKPKKGGERVPSESVTLNFTVTDSGDLQELLSEFHDSYTSNEVSIAPEVVHLSRFAESYKLRCDPDAPTKAAVCRYNAAVANSLRFTGHTRMWNMIASILQGIEDTSSKAKNLSIPNNAMSFILYPTLQSLLMERADASDVQTCVVICEVMEVVTKQQHNSVSVLVPGLDLLLVRQWYISYIDLLQQMCLFSHAASLIGNCQDPEIGKLNQTSTTIHESCPTCNKPLQNGKKACKTCRKKIGFCFLCHEPVTGIFVMCPGCGHGGHLDHALEWFGDLDNKYHELCPTGCGHKCNLVTLPRASHFPRTESLNHLSQPYCKEI